MPCPAKRDGALKKSAAEGERAEGTAGILENVNGKVSLDIVSDCYAKG